MKTKLFSLLFAIVASTTMSFALQTYTVSEAIAALDAGTLKNGDSCQVIGTISKWCTKSSSFDKFHYVSYYITDGIRKFEFNCSYSLNKANFQAYNYTSEKVATCVDVNGQSLFLGDTVVGAGIVRKYTDIYDNDAYEFGAGCYLKDLRQPIIISGSCGESLTWTLNKQDSTLTIDGSGSMINWTSTSYVPWLQLKSCISHVNISDNVTSIGSFAFLGCTGLTFVEIPNDVTSIRQSAFYGCTGLTSVKIPNSVTSIGNNAFNGCTGLTSVKIPNSVTSIGINAFYNVLTIVYDGDATGSPWGARSLNGYVDGYLVYGDETKTNLLACSYAAMGEIIIPNSVTSIGNSAFSGCAGLIALTIPNSVTSIGGKAFYDCSSLTSVTIPNSVTSIGGDAFRYCNQITSVVWNAVNCNSWNFGSQVTSFTFGDSVEVIPASLCSGMNQLAEITIPSSVTSIGNSAFSGCAGLIALTIPNSVTSIGNSAFSGCTGLTSPIYNVHIFAYMPTSHMGIYAIPNGIESIAGGAFYDCIGMTSVTIPNSITSIGENAFYGCIGLTSIEIPNSVSNIGSSAFSGCIGLTSVEIPSSVTIIGDYTFYNCTSLNSVVWNAKNCADMRYFSHHFPDSIISFTIGEKVERIPAYLLYGLSQVVSITIPDKVISIGDGAFYSCSGLTSVTMPESVISIGNHAFRSCTDLTSVTIPNSVTSIGQSAFSGCTSLTSVEIPNSVTSIGSGTFSGCTGLTSIEIPNSVTSIGNNAFSSCSGLTSIELPNSITSIGNGAFSNCSGITEIVCIRDEPATLETNAFPNNDSLSIHVPCGSLDLYQSNWASYASKIKYADLAYSMEVNANIVEAGYFRLPQNACDQIIEAIPNYGYHFTQWSDGIKDNPRTIELTQDTTFTAEFAISKSGVCGDENMLHWRYADDGTLTISGEGALNSNYTFGLEALTGMKSLIVKEGVTAIGDNAFAGKPLAKIDLPQSLTTIGKHAFSDNNALKKVVIPNSVTSIASGAFENGNRLQEIVLGESIATIGDSAFRNCPYILTVRTQMEYPPVVSASVFADCGDLDGIDCYVPEDSYAFYKKTAVWKSFNLIVGEKLFSIIALPYSTQFGTVTGTGAYSAGVEVTMTATPKTGYHFTCWNDGNKDNPRTIVVAHDATYTALFAADEPAGDENVQITTTNDGATISTGLLDDADVKAYRLAICQNNDTICVLTLDDDGHLTGIDFRHAPARMMQQTTAASGLNIPITGLSSGTTYHYTLDALDQYSNILNRKEGDFTTETTTDIDQTSDNQPSVTTRKILRNGQILILRGDKVYTLQGQEVR